MHYCCLVFTNEFPTDRVIAEKMKPFDENDFYNNEKEGDKYPAFLWDWYQIGGRYSAAVKMKRDMDSKDYKWGFYANTPRNNRLFRSQLIDKFLKTTDDQFLVEEDILPYCYEDATDSYRVDAAETHLVVNKEDLYGFNMIRVDGTGTTQEYWDGDKAIPNADYQNEVQKEYNKAKYVCVIDMHD